MNWPTAEAWALDFDDFERTQPVTISDQSEWIGEAEHRAQVAEAVAAWLAEEGKTWKP